MWTGFNKCSMLSYLQTLQTIKNIGKKIGKVLHFFSSLHKQSDITKLYKTILCQKRYLRTVTSQYSYLSVCNVGQKLGICGCLTLVLILFVSHGTIWTWDILLLLQRSLLSPFSRWSDYPVTYGTGTEPQDWWQQLCITHKGGAFFCDKCNRVWLAGSGQDTCTKHGLACVWSKVLQWDSL